MSLNRHLFLFLLIIPVLFLSCMIKTLNGTIVYRRPEKVKQESVEEVKGTRKPKKTMIAPMSGEPSLYAGLRRSSYGLSKRNGADAWWAIRAKEFAASIAANVEDAGYVQPVVIQIVSGYRGDGGTVMEFERPESYTGSTRGMVFTQRGIDHEKALTTYDEEGVKAIIQFESGNSDIMANLEIAHRALGHHKCIIGYGVDAEWYYTKESKDTTGIPVEDEDAKIWMEKVLSFNPRYTLFLKHWDPSHMPLEYRHPNLWYLSDSQIFPDLDSLMDDFSYWSDVMKEQVVGYQYGYPSDRKWWKKMAKPTVEITQRIVKDIPLTRFLFWVDFTADEVDFR